MDDTDFSEDEQVHQDSQTTSRKRSSRACDQCRKTKSKCEQSRDPNKCKSCSLAGTACTFLGPSYKRGPPKGYIHAIEQRWHQVEALLGAILQCPDDRVQGIVSDMKQDVLAREILGRVDSGPYGPSGRRNQPAVATKEDFFASILRSSGSAIGDSSRARRQSRVSREIVSSDQDHGLSVVPTKEWQDNLSKRLEHHPGTGADTRNDDVGPVPQRRRLNDSSQPPPSWDTFHTMPPNDEQDDFKSTTEGMGLLSLDENKEVRFHSEASGLHLLGRNERTDDRIEGGIWQLPMARVWPPSKFGIETSHQGHMDVDMPPLDMQDELIALYFTYIHPVFPLIHKSRFLSEYHARNSGESRENRDSPGLGPRPTYSSPRPEPTQEVTPLLLFCIFAIAARFTDSPKPRDNKMWDAGCDYLDTARCMLDKAFHISRPSTVQALLLLGYREFGIGSMEQGWIFIGMGIRMAFDLGLNCDSSKWKSHGHDLFSPEETQTRRQIWWSCVMTDRYGSMYMGRPIMIRDEDFETPLPDVDPVEDRQPWQPIETIGDMSYNPVPGLTMSTFCAASRLSVITGAIVTQIYPIRPSSIILKRVKLATLESQLDHFYITLPEELRCDTSHKKGSVPPPQIFALHVRYWGAVLLLHRAFIPNWKGHEEAPHKSSIETRAVDLAHSAACHISSLVTYYRDTFTMERTSPFLTSYLLSASIMHLLTLTIRSDTVEASVGLQQCMASLKDIAIIWPSASRAWELLNGVQMRAHAQAPIGQHIDRNKRDAEDAFGEDKASNYLQRQAFGDCFGSDLTQNMNGVQDMSTRLMAHMLGLDVPGVEASTSYYPGYEWWPRTYQNPQPQPPNLQHASNEDYGHAATSPGGMSGHVGESSQWMPSTSTTVPDYGLNNSQYGYDFGQYGYKDI